jgi:hypothetical protein
MKFELNRERDFRIVPGGILIPYQAKYNVANPVTLSSLSDALYNIEKCSTYSRGIVGALTGENAPANMPLYLHHIDEGSVVGDFFLRIAFGSDEERDANIAKFREKYGIKALMDNDKAFALIVTAAITYGAVVAFNKAGGASTSNSISEVHNSVIVQAGGTLNIEPDEFREIVAENTGRRDYVANAASRAMRLARVENASMQVGTILETNLPAEAIATVPDVDLLEPQQRDVDFDNVRLDIRATDFDSIDKGWAAISDIAQIAGKRLPLRVESHIPITDLMFKDHVDADVTVEYKKNSSGTWKAKRIILRHLK